MRSSIQTTDNSSEYRFLAYLNIALVRHKLKYFTQIKSSILSLCDMDEQEDVSSDIEDILVVKSPMMFGFHNELLTEALRQLTKREKYVILESCLAGREHIQIAKDLDITLGAESMLFSRAKRKVRAYMEERENELRPTHSGNEDG